MGTVGANAIPFQQELPGEVRKFLTPCNEGTFHCLSKRYCVWYLQATYDGRPRDGDYLTVLATARTQYTIVLLSRLAATL
eukprot:3517681-Heterocapsa_arctica.AAC.1